MQWSEEEKLESFDHGESPVVVVQRVTKNSKIFRSECESQVKGFKGARFKKFRSHGEAQSFMEGPKFDGSSTAKKPRMINFVERIEKLQKGEKEKDQKDEISDCESEDELFMSLPEHPDGEPSTSSASENLKRKDPRAIKFEPPEPTTEKFYNGHKFQEDSKGFVHVYTDGSCIGNGKWTAAAGFGVYFGENHKLNVSEPVKGRPTNSVGEIQAAIRAIQDAQSCGIKRLCIFTDSQFLINSVCKWMTSWKRKGWKLASGKPVVNHSDFKQLDELIESGNMLIKWSYIPAHKGYRGNEEADRLAKLGSDRYRSKRDRDSEPFKDDEESRPYPF